MSPKSYPLEVTRLFPRHHWSKHPTWTPIPLAIPPMKNSPLETFSLIHSPVDTPASLTKIIKTQALLIISLSSHPFLPAAKTWSTHHLELAPGLKTSKIQFLELGSMTATQAEFPISLSKATAWGRQTGIQRLRSPLVVRNNWFSLWLPQGFIHWRKHQSKVG